MFQSARLKLTAWYLLIIMMISLSFSVFIFRAVNTEFQRRLNAIENRLDLRGYGMHPPTGHKRFFIQDIQEARAKVFFILLYTNGVIFVFSAFAGYILAGKTLQPIEEALEDQKRFVADASHELKTPLTSLQTSIEVALRSKKLTLKEARSVLKDSLKDIDNLKKLTNNLLLLARTGNSDFTKEEIDISNIITKVYNKAKPIAENKGVKLIQKLRPVKISANAESIEKLFTILIDNSIKYSKKGDKVTIKIKEGRRSAKVEIKDTGIGIAKKDLPHIFDRFYRADLSRTTTKSSGYGLGLSIAKKIVSLHGGKIEAKSKINKGSTFTVELPLS